jgi:hypothetical protein
MLHIKDTKERRFTSESRNRILSAIPHVSIGYARDAVMIANTCKFWACGSGKE